MAGRDQIILITGSSGLIGRHIGARLAQAKNFTVVGFDRPGEPSPPEGVVNIPVDLTSDASVREGLALVRRRHGRRLASVIHLAAYYDFTGEPNPLYQQVTVEGTRRLLREVRAAEFHVEQFIFSSTMLVHAPCEPGATINETSPLDPRWPYPRSKQDTEQLIEAERGEMPVLILRISGVYDDICHSIPLAHQIQRIYERRMTSRVFPGHTSHGQSFMHVDDLVEALLQGVKRRSRLSGNTVLLVGEPTPVSYDELQHQLGRLIHDEEWQTTQIPKVVAKTGAWLQDAMPLVDDPFIKPWMIDFADDHYALDISRARALLAWTPTRSLRETIPKMIEALKRDPEAWYRLHELGTPDREQHAAAKKSE